MPRARARARAPPPPPPPLPLSFSLSSFLPCSRPAGCGGRRRRPRPRTRRPHPSCRNRAEAARRRKAGRGPGRWWPRPSGGRRHHPHPHPPRARPTPPRPGGGAFRWAWLALPVIVIVAGVLCWGAGGAARVLRGRAGPVVRRKRGCERKTEKGGRVRGLEGGPPHACWLPPPASPRAPLPPGRLPQLALLCGSRGRAPSPQGLACGLGRAAAARGRRARGGHEVTEWKAGEAAPRVRHWTSHASAGPASRPPWERAPPHAGARLHMPKATGPEVGVVAPGQCAGAGGQRGEGQTRGRLPLSSRALLSSPLRARPVRRRVRVRPRPRLQGIEWSTPNTRTEVNGGAPPLNGAEARPVRLSPLPQKECAEKSACLFFPCLSFFSDQRRAKGAGERARAACSGASARDHARVPHRA